METSIGTGRYGKEAKAMRRMLVLLVLTSLFLSGTALAQTAHVMVQPDDMKWVEGPPSLPRGAKFAVIEGKPVEAGPFTMRLKFPAGYKVPAHSHPAIEHVTVLSGAVNFGMGDKFDASQLKPMPSGSFIVMPIGTNHFVETKEETVIQLHGIGPWDVKYVNPEDDPRKR
jgi:quercetin dioxygenase-like cupin family protein